MTRYGWIFITLIACAAFFGWRHEVAPVGPTRVTILYDRSLSSTGGCAALVGLGGRVLATGAHELALFSTGDLKSAFEPVRLGVIAIPVSTRVMEGRMHTAARRAEYQEVLRSKCQKLSPTKVSPILLALRRALEDAQISAVSAGRPPKTLLYVVTDLRENVDPVFRQKSARRRSEQLIQQIDNSNVSVSFCGYAETAAHEPYAETSSADLRDRWMHLFMHQELVSFEPFCPG